jgi:VanZ family protein
MTKYIFWVITVAWAVLIWRLTTTTQIVVTEEYWLQNILMMGAHFTFFGIQAVLVYYALPASIYLLSPRIYALVMSSAYGALIEFRQLTVPGRSLTQWTGY